MMLQSALQYCRVVAVDDSPEFLSNLRSFFESASDFQLVATAGDGRGALALVEQFHPDLVLMDLQMAGMSGLEATAEIRRRFPKTVVVIITAHEFPGLRQICCDGGAHDVVKKSMLHHELPDVLAKFLSSRGS